MAAHLHHRRRGSIEVGADQIAPVLGVELSGNAGRTHQIAEHDGQIAALANLFGEFDLSTLLKRGLALHGGQGVYGWGWRFVFCPHGWAQLSDRVSDAKPVPGARHAKVPQS